ncbi:MAG: lysophospholipid acyltransferase family protein [Nocardioides sp.]|uniref:lysophospholipid acyltransferase family protein n=1 Tax=Nocardioides sp. TaxID=35761 RepID=UPI003F0979F7
MTPGPDSRLRRVDFPHDRLGWVRPLAQFALRRRWPVTVHGTENVPSAGPVILASNHVGLIDGPLLAVFGPRPVHALTKQEMFASRAGGVLKASGQIRLDRDHADPGAIKACVRVLDAGEVVGIFPEGTRGDGEWGSIRRGAAYLALVSGAPVVPVTMLGTRAPGGTKNSLPPSGGQIDIVYGTPWRVEPVTWPRTREQVGHVSALLHEHLRASTARARDLTGRDLPGPLPAGESTEVSPPGALDQGAS